MTTVWFTADLHLGHGLVSGLRGFDSTTEHDNAILGGIDDALSPGDTLWILGDISSGTKRSETAALDRLRAEFDGNGVDLHLVAGNHDGVHPMHRSAHRRLDDFLRVFNTVQPFARRRIDGNRVWLSHFPWRGGGDHTAVDRYDTVRLNDDGASWLLHGHTHSSERVDRGRRQVHVGLDAWGLRPVSVDQIADLIGEGGRP